MWCGLIAFKCSTHLARAAFDNAGHAVRIVQDLREVETRIYRISLEVDIIQSR